MAYPDCPYMGRAEVRLKAHPLVVLDHFDDLWIKHYFLFQDLFPNQKPKIPPSMAISSSENKRFVKVISD